MQSFESLHQPTYWRALYRLYINIAALPQCALLCLEWCSMASPISVYSYQEKVTSYESLSPHCSLPVCPGVRGPTP